MLEKQGLAEIQFIWSWLSDSNEGTAYSRKT